MKRRCPSNYPCLPSQSQSRQAPQLPAPARAPAPLSRAPAQGLAQARPGVFWSSMSTADILMAARESGECKRIQTRFLPSDDLKQLRLQRRVAENRGIKKELFVLSDSQTSAARTPDMEIIKSSDAFTPAQPMEANTKATTWHWPSSCRSASTKRLCRLACKPFQRASEQSISTTSTYGSGLELTGIEARNQADESKQSLG